MAKKPLVDIFAAHAKEQTEILDFVEMPFRQKQALEELLFDYFLKWVGTRMGGGIRSKLICMGCEEIPHYNPNRPCACPCHPIKEILGLPPK